MKNVLSITHEKIEDKVKIIIPEDVIKKIQYLCTIISTVEWSGILFYTVKGTIKNPSKMVITLKDILPMDRGSASSTEFTYDKRYVEFLMNNEERLNYKSGLIHSHNNMGVFYSSIDQDELKNNSKSHNFYLSVVVNNKLDIIGRIGISGVAETEVSINYESLDENGKPYILSPSTLKVKSEKLYYLDCNVEYTIPVSSIEEEFINNTNYILNKKNEKIFLSPTSTKKEISSYPSKFNYPIWRNDYDNFPKTKGNIELERNNSKKVYNPDRNITRIDNIESENPLEEICKNFLIETFGLDMFFDDRNNISEIDLEDIFCWYDDLVTNGNITITEIVENFSSNFSNFYGQYFGDTIYSYETIINTIIEILEEYEMDYGFLKDIINFINKL